MEPKSLKQVVEDLKTNLDNYFEDAKRTHQDNLEPGEPVFLSLTNNEWAMQIADIYEAAYGEELDLSLLPLE
jgi:hypothetical protein